MHEKLFGFDLSSWKTLFARLEVKWAIKTGIAAGLAYFIGTWYSSFISETGTEKVISGLWCAISAIMASHAHLGGSFKAGWIRFLATGIGSIFGAVFASLLGVNPLSLGITIALAIMSLSFLKLRPSISLTGLTIALVMILWKLNPSSSPWSFAFFRFVDACIGIAITVLISFLIWPERAQLKMHQNMGNILASIWQLFQEIVTFERAPDNALKNWKVLSNKIEKALKKNLLYFEDAKLEMLINKEKLDNWVLLDQKFNQLLELVYSLRLLDKKPFQALQDENLKTTLMQTEENLLLAFKESTFALQNSTSIKKVFNLESSFHQLEKEMERLKNDKVKGISVDFVGNFFVFFYLTKEISDELKDIVLLIDFLKR